MDTATRTDSGLTRFLSVIAALIAVLLFAMFIACLPHMGQSVSSDTLLATEPPELPSETQQTTTEPSEVPTEPEQIEPTLPPPEPNPYGPNDFQYNRKNFLECTEARTLTGIDVSSYQGSPDWQAVREYGVDFAIIRVGLRGYGTGKLKEDPTARDNLKGAAQAGLKVGVYIFSQAITVEEAAEEAHFLLDIITDYDITMPVVFDWEQVGVEDARTNNMDKETLTACTAEFCRIIEEAGYEPMVYFNRHQGTYLLDLAELTDYPFWLAAYTDRMRYQNKFMIWQYTDSGRIPGIEGNVDMNLWIVEE